MIAWQLTLVLIQKHFKETRCCWITFALSLYLGILVFALLVLQLRLQSNSEGAVLGDLTHSQDILRI